MTLTFDLLTSKSIGRILDSWWVSVWSFMIIGWLQSQLSSGNHFQNITTQSVASPRLHKLISIYLHCDLDLWPLTSKINRVHPLIMVNMSAKFDKEICNGLVSIVFTRSTHGRTEPRTHGRTEPQQRYYIPTATRCAGIITMRHDLDLWPFDLKINRAHPWLMVSKCMKFHDQAVVIKLFVLRPEVFQKGTLQPGEKTHTHTNKLSCYCQYNVIALREF